MSDDILEIITTIGNEQLEVVKGKLGDLWNNFNQNDKDLAVAIAKDSATLQFDAMRNPDTDMSAEWKHIDAQIKNITSSNLSAFRIAFWETVGGVVKSGLGGVVKAGFGGLLGI